jgi:hypothetical protein
MQAKYANAVFIVSPFLAALHPPLRTHAVRILHAAYGPSRIQLIRDQQSNLAVSSRPFRSLACTTSGYSHHFLMLVRFS